MTRVIILEQRIKKRHIRNIRVDGDGFGLVFYGNTPEKGSCLFKFVSPVCFNKNLINIGGYVRSTLIMGHIRAATSGADPLEPQSILLKTATHLNLISGHSCIMEEFLASVKSSSHC